MNRFGGWIILVAAGIAMLVWCKIVVNRILDLVAEKRQRDKLSKLVSARLGPAVNRLVETVGVAHPEDPAAFAHPLSNALALVVAAVWVLQRSGASPGTTRDLVGKATELGLDLVETVRKEIR